MDTLQTLCAKQALQFNLPIVAIPGEVRAAIEAQQFLRDHNSNPSISFQLAARHGLLNIAFELLKQYPNDINPNDTINDEPALHIAASRGCLKIVIFLVNNMDFRVTNREGENALHVAARKGQLEVVNILAHRLDPNDVDSKGRNALHHIAMYANNKKIDSIFGDGFAAKLTDVLHTINHPLEVAQTLTPLMRNINALDNKIRSAIDLAEKAGNHQIAAYLRGIQG